MAKKDQLDEKHSFDVTLKKPITVGRRTIHPGPRVVLRGDILAAAIAADPDAVDEYTVQK